MPHFNIITTSISECLLVHCPHTCNSLLFVHRRKFHECQPLLLLYLVVHNFLIVFGAVERRIAAVQAIRETEKERLLTELRLLRSCLSKEHLQTKALDFFRENLPNLSVIRNEEDLEFELDWKVKDFQVRSDTDDRFMHMYPGIFSSLPRISGFGFSSKPGLSST